MEPCEFSTSVSYVGFTSTAPQNGEQTIPDMNATAAYIDAINPDHRPFLADWPGFYVAGQIPEFSGMENNFGFEAAKAIGLKRARKYHILHPYELAGLLKSGDLPVVVRTPSIGKTSNKFG